MDVAANGDRPSAHGRLLGKALALMADLGRRDAPMAIPEPFSEVKEVLAAFHEELKRVEEQPDEVRAAFDAWLNRADPERRMDVYQAARAYAREVLAA